MPICLLMANLRLAKYIMVFFLSFAVTTTSVVSFNAAAGENTVGSEKKKKKKKRYASNSNKKTEATYCGPKCQAKKKGLKKLPTKKKKVKRACEGNPSLKGRRCPDLTDDILKAGVGGNVKCWEELFHRENSCGTCPITAAQGNNPHHGWGLCTIESSYTLRKRRGGTCAKKDISSLNDQIKCCAEMMAAFGKSNSYFGPVKRGKMKKCK